MFQIEHAVFGHILGGYEYIAHIPVDIGIPVQTQMKRTDSHTDHVGDFFRSIYRIDFDGYNFLATLAYGTYGKIHKDSSVDIIDMIDFPGSKDYRDRAGSNNAGEKFSLFKMDGYSSVNVTGCNNQGNFQFFKSLDMQKFCQPFFHTVHNHDPFLRHGGTGKMQNFFPQEKIQTFFGGMTGGNHGSDNRAGTGARDDIGTEACFIHGLYDSDVGEAPGSTAAEHQS